MPRVRDPAPREYDDRVSVQLKFASSDRSRLYVSRINPSVYQRIRDRWRRATGLSPIELWYTTEAHLESRVKTRRKAKRADLPQVWRWFSFILPGPTRMRVFEPHFNEIVDDYLQVRKLRPGNWVRHWLAFAFTFRTALMVLDCVRALVLDKLAWMMPKAMRDWWVGPGS